MIDRFDANVGIAGGSEQFKLGVGNAAF